MIHVVTIENQHFYAHQLDEMFRMRHRFYVEGHKWKDLKSSDGLETDEFDNEQAIYLIALDRFARVAAALRLNPTTGPNLLADKLSHFATEMPPRSPEIWDMTRWIVAERYRRSNRSGRRLMPSETLSCGLLEFAHSRGITHFTDISEARLTPLLDASNWKYWPLGPIMDYENGKGQAQALLLDASVEQLMRQRARLGLTESVLFELKAPPLEDSPVDAHKRMMERQLATAMAHSDRSEVQLQVMTLADELAEATADDPVGAVEAIQNFSQLLVERLNTTAIADENDDSKIAI